MPTNRRDHEKSGEDNDESSGVVRKDSTAVNFPPEPLPPAPDAGDDEAARLAMDVEYGAALSSFNNREAAPEPAIVGVVASAPVRVNDEQVELADEFSEDLAMDDVELIDDFEVVEDIEPIPQEAPRHYPRAQTPPPLPPVATSALPETSPPQAISLSGVVDRSYHEPSPLEVAHTEATNADWERRAAALERELAAAEDKQVIGSLAYELGELYARHLDDEARSVKALGRALQADPSLRANLWAIRRVFYRRELWPNLLKLIDAELRFAHDDTERAELLVEKARVLEDRVGKVSEAKEVYEAALGHDPTCAAGLMALERHALIDNQPERLEKLWRALADQSATPGRKLVYLLDLARLVGDRGDPESIAQARAVLSEAATVGVQLDRVAAERERLAELTGDGSELLASLEMRAELLLAEFGDAGPPEPSPEPRPCGEPLDRVTSLLLQVVALRRRQAQVARSLCDDREAAWRYLLQGAELAPSEPLLLRDLLAAAEDLGRFEDVADLCLRLRPLDQRPERALELALRRADALARAERNDESAQLLAELTAAHPGYLPATALMERAALASGDWAALATSYEQAARALRSGTPFGPGTAVARDKVGAAAYLVAAGDLYAHFLNEEGQARAHYGRALEVSPGFPSAVEALASLHEAHSRLEDAAQLLELHTEVGDDDFRRDALERLARIYDELARPAEQQSALQRLLQMDPNNDRLRWRIEEVLAAQGLASQRAEVLAELAARADNPDALAAIQLELARVYDEELDEPVRAAEAYRAVLEAWPSDRYTWSALTALLRRAELWAELVEARQAEAEQLTDGTGVARALREAASVLLHRLSRPADAARIYRNLLDREPGEVHAAHGLADALAHAGDHEALMEVLEREVDAYAPGPAQACALIRLAEAQERAGRLEAAADSFRQAKAVQVGGDPSYAAIAQWHLAAARGDRLALFEAIEALIGGPRDLDVRSELLEELGWICARDLEDDARAIVSFDDAAEAAPDRLGPRLGQWLMRSAHGESDGLSAALAGLANGREPRVGAALRLRAAAVREAQGDAVGASQLVAAALQADPAGTDAIVAACDRPVQAIGPNEEAARAALLRQRAGLAVDSGLWQHFTLEGAEALERAGQPAAALQALREVLERNPTSVRALQAVRRLCRQNNLREGLAQASLTLANILCDAAGEIELVREAAAIYDAELGQPGQAAPIFRRLLKLEPLASEYHRLHEICRDAGERRGLYEILSDRLAHVQLDSDRVGLWIERAELRRGFGDRRGAARDLAHALTAEPDNLQALRAQAGVLLSLDDAAGGAGLLRRYVDLETDLDLRAAAELELSEILAESMDDTAGAIERLEQVVAAKPDDLNARDRMVSLLLGAGEPRRAVQQVEQLEARRDTAAGQARDQLRIAEIYRDRLDEPDAAAEVLGRARQLDPLNLDVVRDLAALTAQGRARRAVLARATADVRAAIATEPVRGDLYDRLAMIARWSEEQTARYFACAAAAALGIVASDAQEFLEAHSTRLNGAGFSPSTSMSAADWLSHVTHDRAVGFTYELWQVVADSVGRSLPSEPAQLGFARGDKCAARAIAREFPAVHTVASAFGVTGYELYVNDSKERYARVTSTEPPAIYLGGNVARAVSLEDRFLLGRTMAMAKERSGALADLEPDELAVLLTIACEVAEVDPETVTVLAGAKARAGNHYDERLRQLSKQLGRKGRRNLALLGPRMSELQDPIQWRSAMLSTASRAGMLVCADISAAFEVLDVGRGGRSLTEQPEAQELLAWSVGEHHMALRKQLELGA